MPIEGESRRDLSQHARGENYKSAEEAFPRILAAETADFQAIPIPQLPALSRQLAPSCECLETQPHL